MILIMIKTGCNMAKTKEEKIENFEAQLFKAADKLRKNIDAAEYKHIVLGLIFLKYISDSFAEHYEVLKAGKGEYEGANPEDETSTKPKIYFGLQLMRVGLTCIHVPNSRVLARILMKPWNLLKKKITLLKESSLRFTLDLISIKLP